MEFKERTIHQLPRPGNRLTGILIAIVAISLLFACGSHSNSSAPPASPVPGQLVSWSPAGSFSAQLLNLGIATLGITGITATSGAACYKLTYETPDATGSLVHASGLVCLPTTGSSNRPVISYQHGTIFQEQRRPLESLDEP